MKLLRNALLAAMTLAGLMLFNPSTVVSQADATVIGGRPPGCPARYCGCATARKVGLSGAKWNLAANYLTLPRASCAPGMVAARRGHVFVIQSCNGNGTVTAWDPNSGGGKTRIHTRSLAGYAVVNPRGGGGGYTAFAWWKGQGQLDRKPRYKRTKQYRQHRYAKVRPQARARYAHAR